MGEFIGNLLGGAAQGGSSGSIGAGRQNVKQKNTYLAENGSIRPLEDIMAQLGGEANQQRAQRNLLFGGGGYGGSFMTPDQLAARKAGTSLNEKGYGGWGGYGSSNPTLNWKGPGAAPATTPATEVPNPALNPGDAGGEVGGELGGGTGGTGGVGGIGGLGTGGGGGGIGGATPVGPPGSELPAGVGPGPSVGTTGGGGDLYSKAAGGGLVPGRNMMDLRQVQNSPQVKAVQALG